MNIIGEIKLFAGAYTPIGWMDCDGSKLPIPQYKKLFSVIGYTYTTISGSGGVAGYPAGYTKPIYFALPSGKPLIPGTKWIICVEGYFPTEDDYDIRMNLKTADLMTSDRKEKSTIIETKVKSYQENIYFYSEGKEYDNYDPLNDEFLRG